MKKHKNILSADAGKVLSNGNVYGRKIYLAPGADESVWQEIDEPEVIENEHDMD